MSDFVPTPWFHPTQTPLRRGRYRSDPDFVLFDVKVDDWWLRRADMHDVARKMDLDLVPIIGEGTLHDAVAMAKAGIYSSWGDFQAEGLVARAKTELTTHDGQRIITKNQCRDFAENKPSPRRSSPGRNRMG